MLYGVGTRSSEHEQRTENHQRRAERHREGRALVEEEGLAVSCVPTASPFAGAAGAQGRR